MCQKVCQQTHLLPQFWILPIESASKHVAIDASLATSRSSRARKITIGTIKEIYYNYVLIV